MKKVSKKRAARSLPLFFIFGMPARIFSRLTGWRIATLQRDPRTIRATKGPPLSIIAPCKSKARGHAHSPRWAIFTVGVDQNGPWASIGIHRTYGSAEYGDEGQNRLVEIKIRRPSESDIKMKSFRHLDGFKVMIEAGPKEDGRDALTEVNLTWLYDDIAAKVVTMAIADTKRFGHGLIRVLNNRRRQSKVQKALAHMSKRRPYRRAKRGMASLTRKPRNQQYDVTNGHIGFAA